MANTVIRVENLSKLYRIGASRKRHDDLRDLLAGAAKRLMRPGNRAAQREDTIWAIKDVSFEVKQGEVVGIIGRNGAGKSTLLKVLARITEPTEGCIEITGRVGSLLEVGTGFHPELTGRENIYLNGAVLGMKKKEIDRKFDEIVDFAEVNKFIDTPVKRYSSGMYVRLAFAVAAHLDPEILFVDEVLAVGDAAFQKKCLARMGDIAEKGGRTVLFVSHNMEAVASLCTHGLFLSAGSLLHAGDAGETISFYENVVAKDEPSVDTCSRRGGSGGITIASVWLTNEKNEKTHTITPHEQIYLNLEALVSEEYRKNKAIVVGFGVDSLRGGRLLTCVSSWVDTAIIANRERFVVRCVLPSLPLVPQRYLVSASVSYNNDTHDYVEHCAYLEIVENEIPLFKARSREHGYLNVPYRFEMSDV
jgi:lipopolysaccharide transport system ATP-binding protein